MMNVNLNFCKLSSVDGNKNPNLDDLKISRDIDDKDSGEYQEDNSPVIYEILGIIKNFNTFGLTSDTPRLLINLFDSLKNGVITADEVDEQLFNILDLAKKELEAVANQVPDMCVLIDNIANNTLSTQANQKIQKAIEDIKTNNTPQNLLAVINSHCGTNFKTHDDIVNYLSSNEVKPEHLELMVTVLFTEAVSNFEVSSINKTIETSLKDEVRDFQATINMPSAKINEIEVESSTMNMVTNNQIIDHDLFLTLSSILNPVENNKHNDYYNQLPKLIKILDSHGIDWQSGHAVDRELVGNIFQNKIEEINQLIKKYQNIFIKNSKPIVLLPKFKKKSGKRLTVNRKELSDLYINCDELIQEI